MVQDCVFARISEFQFKEKTGITLVRQVRSLENLKNGYNLGLAGSELGERLVPFSELRTLAD